MKKEDKSLNSDDFSQKEEIISKMNGWFDAYSLTIFDILLNLQLKNKIYGNILEIGVWEGKSAAAFIDKLYDKDKLYLVDPELKTKKEKVSKNLSLISHNSKEKVFYFPLKSEDFKNEIATLHILNSFRFIHIDGNHTAEDVYKDLELADLLLFNNGIVVLDDFFNMIYPQVTEAIFNYIFTNPYRFKLFLCGYNKAYLCRPSLYSKYYTYVISFFQKEFIIRNKTVSINKTSSIGDSYSVSLTNFSLNDCNEKGIRGPDWKKDNIEIIADINTGIGGD